MEQPILSVEQRKGPSQEVTPNLLPCRIHHDGSVGSADAYWTPSQEPGMSDKSATVRSYLLTSSPDGNRIAYFRGRKLHGKALKVPEGYRGVVVEKTNAPKPQASRPDEPEVIDIDMEDEVPLGTLETKAEFDEMLIWGHETTADAASDPYVRGVEEWIRVAEQVCGCIWDAFGLVLTLSRYIHTTLGEKKTKRFV